MHFYRAWKEVWISNLIELGQNSADFTSDDFMMQDELLALRINSQIIGMFFFKWWNLEVEFTQDHSYFRKFPENVFSQLANGRSNILMTMSHLTVLPTWRRTHSRLNISDLLVSFAVKRFLDSDAGVLFTYTRNDRKTNDLGVRHGGIPIDVPFTYNGIDSDILVFSRDKVKLSPLLGVGESVEEIWGRFNQSKNTDSEYGNGFYFQNKSKGNKQNEIPRIE